MKTNYDFVKREMFGEYYLVPVGEAAAKFDGLIAINELAAFIFDVLPSCNSATEIAKKIAAEYDIDVATALGDTEEFFKNFGELGVIFE